MSAPYENILMSVILETELQSHRIFFLTMIASIAVVNAVKNSTILNPLIKWPNDIYINNKKAAGILTEIHIKKNVKYAIIGIGINVNSDISFYPEIRNNATSIKNESGSEVSRIKLLCDILEAIESGYRMVNQSEFSKILNEWEKYSMITGKEVLLTNGDNSETGIAGSLADDGSLILLKENGIIKNVYAGDISLRKKQ
jgi:BirA family transcriptional regulator, biotin operon repressor / biotin---[acetyl-CoA-carboxylase] ligase